MAGATEVIDDLLYAAELDGDTAERIVHDVGNGVPIEKSRVTYGELERRYRADIEAWWAQKQLDDPAAMLDTGFNAPSDMPIPERPQ